MRYVLVLFIVCLASAQDSLIASRTRNRLAWNLDRADRFHDVRETDFAFLDKKLFGRWKDVVTGKVDNNFSVSLNYGITYSPTNNVNFLLTSFRWQYDYEDFWVHSAPDTLKLVLEFAAGSRIRYGERGVISCGAFAQRYLRFLSNKTFQPYVDLGIGIIYTDFQIEDQGLRLNFNPRVSIGTDIRFSQDSPPWFVALRIFHISNGGLHEENTGMNGTMLVIGRYF